MDDDLTSTARLSPEPSAKSPVRGTIVSDKYRLLRPLGKGGMGLVFEAEHLRLGQRVAIKFLRPDLLALPDACSRFEREARASARLRGPHVVQVLDVDTDRDGLPYIVMERVTGRDLEAELHARGRLAIGEAVDCILQACAALAEAHAAGIVHRDLKPSNLFLADESGIRVLKVLDFGISKISAEPETSVTSAAITLGTPLYMSPEQVRSSKDVDERTDIWSLGVILYELLAGAPPFSGSTTAAIAAIVADAVPSLRRLRPEVPAQLDRVIVRALAKSSSDRFPTAEALATALLPFASAGGFASVCGPPISFSLRRPSARAFALPCDALARPASTRRELCSSELPEPRTLRNRKPDRMLRPNGAIRPSEALRTFAGTLAIGIAIASGMALGSARAASTAATRRTAGAPAASGGVKSPNPTTPREAARSAAAARSVNRRADEGPTVGHGDPTVQIAAVAPPATALVVSPEPAPTSRATSTTSSAAVPDPAGRAGLTRMRE